MEKLDVSEFISKAIYTLSSWMDKVLPFLLVWQIFVGEYMRAILLTGLIIMSTLKDLQCSVKEFLDNVEEEEEEDQQKEAITHD
jgi:hypothetical protein